MCPIYHVGKSTKRMNERLRFSTHKVKCWLWLDGAPAPIPGFGFASDISETGVGIYFDRKVNVGTTVRIALEEDGSSPFPGVVAWCQRYSLEQKFHGHDTLDHRLGIRFAFESEGERQRYIMFFNELRRRVTLLAKGPVF
jgi:hypothetical protein